MAKYEKRLTGNLDELLSVLHSDITEGSISASLEDGSDIKIDQIRVAVRVYERYSMIGGNRVSLNITVAANGSDLYLSAIASGGSQAVFFKVNTFGEEAFLQSVVKSVEYYVSNHS